METDIDNIKKEFFKKSLSVGHHNVKYTWMQIMLMILNCIKGFETFEGGAKSPSPQTMRDRLNLEGTWLGYFHDSMWSIARLMLKRFSRLRWFISIDETHVPFFGDRKKLNEDLVKKGVGKYVHGYRAKTPGATGSFCFLVVSLCCSKIRIPLAVKMVKVGERYRSWLKVLLQRMLKLAPKAKILADRGYGKATWFFLMMEELGAEYVLRMPLRKKESKNKVSLGKKHFQQWMKDVKTKEKALLDIYVAKDNKGREYILASNIQDKSIRQLLQYYHNRWDLENIFKDADRVELPTSSRNPLMRMYCIVVSFLIFTLWQVERVLTKTTLSLRQIVKQFVACLCKAINCLISPIGEILEAVT